MEYKEWCAKLESTLRPYIDLFREDLEKTDLSPKTIRKHIGNIELFLYDYTTRYFEVSDKEADIELYEVLLDYGMFVGYFFIRKCLWSSPSSVRALCASLKKFFKSMLDHGKLTKDEYDELTFNWKERVEEWVEECEDYDNGIDHTMDFLDYLD